MLTLFAVPKPLDARSAPIQRAALASWLKLEPRCAILLLGDAEGTAALAREAGVHHVPNVDCTAANTPRLDRVFALAERHAASDLLCYVNADIVLPVELPAIVQRVARRRSRFLLTGQRWDVTDCSRRDLRSTTNAALRELAGRWGTPSGAGATDYFVFRRGLWPSIPPFALGRTTWDNWLIYGARAAGAAVVDASRDLACIHQCHDYDHVAGGADEVWRGAEARANFALAEHGRCVYTLDDATWLLRGGRLLPALTPRHLARRWRHLRRHQRHVRSVRHALQRWPIVQRWGLAAEAAAVPGGSRMPVAGGERP